MDLNYLYLRQLVSLVRAERAACAPSRAAHADLAHRYGSLIERQRSDRRVQSRASRPITACSA